MSMNGTLSSLEVAEKKDKKRDRTNEKVSRNLRSIMNRLDSLRARYDLDIYLCARHKRYFEYVSSPSFRPSVADIVSNQ